MKPRIRISQPDPVWAARRERVAQYHRDMADASIPYCTETVRGKRHKLGMNMGSCHTCAMTQPDPSQEK
jgi:hypothetical protein